jgi:aminoglycoside 2'-N-acetyltransferase I
VSAEPPGPALLVARTDELGKERFAEINALVERAFGRPFAEIWTDIGPGIHVVAEIAGEPVGHAMVVERGLEIGRVALRCGYVENVATDPARHRQGIGTVVMRRIGEVIASGFEIGALATGTHAFYEQLGWETWRGTTYARRDGNLMRTPGHDGEVMVLRVPATPPLPGVEEPIVVGWRRGELW